jgi:PAS domain S-box-containing protein
MLTFVFKHSSPMSSAPIHPSPHDAAQSVPDLRFQELFEQAPVSIQILAPDGRTTRVNKAWENLWQIHEGSALKAFVLSAEYNVLNDPQLVKTGISLLLARAFAGEAVEIPSAKYDVTALAGSGPARWVTARAHPIKDGAGKVLEVMLIHEDITERMHNETALRIREERFRSLVMATSQIIWSNTPDGRVLEDSPSWRAFTGQTYDEWKEFGWLDALHPDDRAATEAKWLACVASRSVFETKYRIRCPDGNYRWTAVKGVPILTEDGTIREWIGANTDIHDMVMAEIELAQRLDHEKRTSALLAKVAQAARTLHTVLSSEEIAKALVAEVRDILQAHQAVVSLTENGGWSQAINAISLSDKYAGYRDYAVKTDGSGIYAEVCRDNRVMRLSQAELVAHPAWKAFGGQAHAHPPMRGWLAVPLIDRTGKNIGLIQASDKHDGDFTPEDEAILVQLASIAATGFENARLVGSLQEQDRRKDEFLAMLAHELRNPLAPITSAAQLLQFKAADERQVLKSSEIISRQARHLTSLVDSLLDVSRVTHGLIELATAVVDPLAVVAAAIEQSQPLIVAKNQALVVEGDAGGASILGDQIRLTQVLVNLLNNATKYTPSGGRIWLTIAHRDGAVSLGVRDNGIGIDAVLLPQVFGLFTQAERSPNRAQSGLGIGLALAKEIIALHGGQLTAESDGLGAGSSFTVTLNATAPAAAKT